MAKIKIVYYSMYGHIHQMAQAVGQGAESVEGVEVSLYRVPELISDEVLDRQKAGAKNLGFDSISMATPDDLRDADGIVFGTPTRFGNMAAQMRNFLDQTGKLWAEGALIDKIGSVFVATSTQHGGQETTISSFHTTLLHHGMIIAGVPYSVKELTQIDEISGGSPYGAGMIAGGDGSRQPSENELTIARKQGQRVAELVTKLTRQRFNRLFFPCIDNRL